MSEWISVDDKYQPPTDCDILLMTTEGQAVGTFEGGGRFYVSGSVDTSYDMAVAVLLGHVTHWMPLPEPPEDV